MAAAACEYEPVSQLIHANVLVAPAADEYVPARQLVQEDALLELQVPGLHMMHAEAPEPE